jgi:hypothetical protein
MNLSTVVNVDVKMPAKMLNALSIYETTCVMTNKHKTSEEDVKKFLEQKYGSALASQFKSEYLLSSRAPSECPQ